MCYNARGKTTPQGRKMNIRTFFTCPAKWSHRLLAIIILSTILTLPVSYVAYTAIENAKTLTVMPYASKSGLLSVLVPLRDEHNGDVTSFCGANDVKPETLASCEDTFSFFGEAVKSQAFWDAVDALPDDIESTFTRIKNSWWLPAPLLQQDADVKALLNFTAVRAELAGSKPIEEIWEEEITPTISILKFTLLFFWLALIVVSTLHLIYHEDGVRKGKKMQAACLYCVVLLHGTLMTIAFSSPIMFMI